MATTEGERKGPAIVFKLDDGTIIGDGKKLVANAPPGQAVWLDMEHAFHLGHLKEADLQRLSNHLKQFKQHVPGFDALPKHLLKANNPYAPEMQRMFKRQKSNVAAAVANGELGVASPPNAAPPRHAAPAGGDWQAKCYEVFTQVVHEIPTREAYYMVSARDVWYKSVAETFPAIAPTYYAAIKQPMCLGEVERKLRSGRYAGAQDFADDMALIWRNAKTFNPSPADQIHRAAQRMEEKWEKLWAGSGLCIDRGKRATAGLARERFDPELYEQLAPQHETSGKPRKRKADDMGRARSHEVSSYEPVAVQEVPQELLAEVANSIQELAPELQQQALEKLNPEVISQGEDGEMELDFEKITLEALMAVDTFIRASQGLPPRPPPLASHAAAGAGGAITSEQRRRGARLEQSDSDYEEDDSDMDSE